MHKMIDRVGICLLIAAFFWCGTLISDRQRLNRELIRLHIVAASDGAEDQARKLRVRDAVTQSLQSDLQKLTDAEQARAYLQEKLPDIQQVASRTLQSLGCQDSVRVSLCKEAFDTRVYDTFSLPSGKGTQLVVRGVSGAVRSGGIGGLCGYGSGSRVPGWPEPGTSRAAGV